MLYTSLLYYTTLIHCTPPPTAPPYEYPGAGPRVLRRRRPRHRHPGGGRVKQMNTNKQQEINVKQTHILFNEGKKQKHPGGGRRHQLQRALAPPDLHPPRRPHGAV